VIAVEQVAEVLVGVADTLVGDFDVVEFLEMVARHSASVSNAASAGVLLADARGQLQFMAASKESVKLLELFQIQNQEGPCLECFYAGSAVVNTDLARAGERWPLFAPRAVASGFLSVHAFPLRHRRNVIGALNLFSTNIGRLDPDDVKIIQALADLATIGLLKERGSRNPDWEAKRLEEALKVRVTIEQAQGVLAERHGIDADGAYELMRRYARRHNLLLSQAAHALVTERTGALDRVASQPADYPEHVRNKKVNAAGGSSSENLLKPSEVALMFRVDPKTIVRWANTGKLTPIRTLGGHRRFLESEVSRLLRLDRSPDVI
jgi:transcriptional regulator with GAF, ATPase, and Fis domain